MHIPPPITDDLIADVARVAGSSRRAVVRRMAGLPVRPWHRLLVIDRVLAAIGVRRASTETHHG